MPSVMSKPVRYKFYATLLDAFQSYLSSSEIYQQYYGFAENPALTEEEFEKQSYDDLINKINRVPIDSEAADKGTAFNEVVDCIILGVKSSKMDVSSSKETGMITAIYNGRTFSFPIAACMEFASYYKGATPQVFTDAVLPTTYGNVLLYGFIDELMPMSVHDIKTTMKYFVGKYRNNWQHRVYPYCLNMSGNDIRHFEYNVAEITKSGKVNTYTEQYTYRPDRDVALLIEHCDLLIEFISSNSHLITNKRIYGEE